MTRNEILPLIESIAPLDSRELADKQKTIDWIKSDAPLYRIQKPDVPPMHLVSYFAIIDPQTHKMLLQDHLLAKLWLPAGGHVDPNEDPAETVRRECMEELGIPAEFFGDPTPRFITITQTNEQGNHTDVSLWYILQASESTAFTIEPDKFAEVRWWDIDQILATSIEQFDPELHRFIAKINNSNQ
jgi:8-oxo-dGTP pyrophosphatase MutT (NUDIX family)